MVSTPVAAGTPAVALLRTPWEPALEELLATPQSTLILASPFITRRISDWIGNELVKNKSAQTLKVLCLTNVRLESMLAGSLELEGLADLSQEFRNFSTVHLPALHAKVFVADDELAIVTSGNLTTGGIFRNYEYGVALRSRPVVREIRLDFENYARLGAVLSIGDLKGFATDIAGLREQFNRNERKVFKQADGDLKKKLRAAKDKIYTFRARGTSNQSIFRATIEYLLAKGPLKTTELHPQIQQLHPDLCDDAVDRVIEGVNFGKRWKHLVRNAQQALKREGRVTYDGQRWHLRS